MTKQILINRLENLKFENFLQEFRFLIDEYLTKNQNDNVIKIKEEITNLVNTTNSLIDDVDYRRLSYSEYENKVNELKINTLNLIEKIPAEIFEQEENKTGTHNNKLLNFSAKETEMTAEEKKQLRRKYIVVSSIWGIITVVSFLLIVSLPRYLKEISQLGIFMFMISAPVFFIYFLVNFKLLKAKSKVILTGNLRKYSRLSETRKNRHLKYFFSVGNHEFMVSIFEYNRFEDYDNVELHFCTANRKIISMKKL